MKWYLDSFLEKDGERLLLSCPSGPRFVPRSSFDEPVEELPLPLTMHTIPKEFDFLGRQQWSVGSHFMLFWFWSVLCLFHCGLASIARSICLSFLFPFFDKIFLWYQKDIYCFTASVILLALLFLDCLCLCYRCRCCFRWLSCWFRSLPCLCLVGCMLSLLLLHREIAKHWPWTFESRNASCKQQRPLSNLAMLHI